MPVDVNEILELLSTLAREERLQVAIRQAVRGGLIAGGMAAGGALLGGPILMAVGGTVGSLIAAGTSTDFKPVVHIIRTMNPREKEVLAQRVRVIMNNFNVTDVAAFVALMSGNIAVRQEAVNALVTYLTADMGMVLANH